MQILKEGAGYSDIKLTIERTNTNTVVKTIHFKDLSLQKPCRLLFSSEDVNKMAQQYTVSRFVSFMISFDIRARMLMDFIMYWRKCCVDFITELQLQLLVIFFLERENIVPTISRLQNISMDNYIIDGWNFSFCTDFKTISTIFDFPIGKSNIESATKRFPSLLHDFFVKFSLKTCFSNVIGVSTGTFLERTKCKFPGQFEALMNKDYNRPPYTIKDAHFSVQDISSPVVIQHPFILNKSISSLLTQTELEDVTNYCSKSAAHLSKYIIENYPKPFLHVFFDYTFPRVSNANKGSAPHSLDVASIKQSLSVGNTRVWTVTIDSEFYRACSFVMELGSIPSDKSKIESLWRLFVCDFFDSVWSQTIFGVSSAIDSSYWKNLTASTDLVNKSLWDEYEWESREIKRSFEHVRAKNLKKTLSHPLYPLIASSRRSHQEWNELWNWTDVNEIRASLGPADPVTVRSMIEKIPSDSTLTASKMKLYLVQWIPYFWFSRNKLNLTVENTGKKFSSPMEKQLYITEQAMKAGSLTTHAPKGYGAMFCEARIENDHGILLDGHNVQGPGVTYSVIGDMDSSSEWAPPFFSSGIPCLAKMIKELIPRYIKWRFREWIISKNL